MDLSEIDVDVILTLSVVKGKDLKIRTTPQLQILHRLRGGG